MITMPPRKSNIEIIIMPLSHCDTYRAFSWFSQSESFSKSDSSWSDSVSSFVVSSPVFLNGSPWLIAVLILLRMRIWSSVKAAAGWSCLRALCIFSNTRVYLRSSSLWFFGGAGHDGGIITGLSGSGGRCLFSSTKWSGNGIGFSIAWWVYLTGPLPSLKMPSSSSLVSSFFSTALFGIPLFL